MTPTDATSDNADLLDHDDMPALDYVPERAPPGTWFVSPDDFMSRLTAAASGVDVPPTTGRAVGAAAGTAADPSAGGPASPSPRPPSQPTFSYGPPTPLQSFSYVPTSRPPRDPSAFTGRFRYDAATITWDCDVNGIPAATTAVHGVPLASAGAVAAPAAPAAAKETKTAAGGGG